jgi:2-oxoglutarate ferredoxin oxidoreductase subunit beta
MAAATGVTRCIGEGVLVIAYHGDGDAYNIGLSETFNAGYRNENIVDIVVNNSLYGMTGGQMSHTTLIGEWTENYPGGRDPEVTGYPLRYPEMVRHGLPHAFLARGGVFNPVEVRKTKELLSTAFERQLAGDGYSLVEILSMCPTNAHKTPLETRDWVESEMAAYYPLGVIQKGSSKGLIENY